MTTGLLGVLYLAGAGAGLALGATPHRLAALALLLGAAARFASPRRGPARRGPAHPVGPARRPPRAGLPLRR